MFSVEKLLFFDVEGFVELFEFLIRERLTQQGCIAKITEIRCVNYEKDVMYSGTNIQIHICICKYQSNYLYSPFFVNSYIFVCV